MPQVDHGSAGGVNFARYAARARHFVKRWGRLSPGAQDFLQIDVVIAVPGKIVDAFPGFVRPFAECGEMEAVCQGSLKQDFEIGGLRIEADQLRLRFSNRREKPLQQFRLGQASVLGLRQREQHELWSRSLVSFADDNRHGYNSAEHSLEIRTRLVRGGSTLPPHFLDNLQVR